jgi:2',3'-cyclic-nucleotide 2'-phosphodiesterase (5'-nucleotidase family)
MITKSKNSNVSTLKFVITLTLLFIIGCKTSKFVNYKTEATKIEIQNQNTGKQEILDYIAPYKQRIDTDLNEVLSVSPVVFDKNSGKWQSNIGDFLAKITYELSNPIFLKRENKNIDIVMLNHGGIRNIIPKGNVTTRTAFEVFPFENSILVIGLQGKQIREMIDLLITDKKPHPLHGIEIYISKENKASKILVNGALLQDEKTYFVATSDYLANGGDNMVFFTQSTIRYDIDYKLRSLLIDYLKTHKTLEEVNIKKIYTE